jgi:myo-inositol 2-dehydrogenase / D-chiro-inositol 1-dehydrogenase
MAKVAILGAGRIAEVHARGALLAGAQLAGIYDIRKDAAARLAARFSTQVLGSVDEALRDRSVDVIAIATSTDTHADYIVRAAQAGKAIFCEKPIDLSVARVEQCRKDIEGTNAFIQIGFNRRFDPTFVKVASTVKQGKIGRLESLTIISRDPAPASIEYLKVSGGLFKDMAIHDFDMARFILPEEPVEVFATGSVLVSREIGAIDDIDSSTVVLRTRSGILCQIMNSRRAVFGFDQRMEAFGSEGVIFADNPRLEHTRLSTKDATDSKAKLPDFFLERYTESYNLEWQGLLQSLASQRAPIATFDDGVQALKIAEAANRSLKSRAIVPID